MYETNREIERWKLLGTIAQLKQKFYHPILGFMTISPLILNDSVNISVQSSKQHYCSERSGDTITSVELLVPDVLPNHKMYDEETNNGYLYFHFPVSFLMDIIMLHGGIDVEATMKNADKVLNTG